MGARGFTVVESVLGFTLVSLGIVAILAMLNTSLFLSAQTQHGVQSEQMLQQLIDFYSQDYPRYGDDTYTLDPLTGVDRLQYRRQFTLSTYSTDLAVPVRRLEVQVSYYWKDRTYQRQRVRLLCKPAR